MNYLACIYIYIYIYIYMNITKNQSGFPGLGFRRKYLCIFYVLTIVYFFVLRI